ncbi:MAG: PAS domain-containing protein, partial [Terracidiphilus sp.]
MEALTQLGLPGVAAATEGGIFAFWLPAGSQIFVHWAAVALLMVLSAVAGAWMYCLRAKERDRKRDDESMNRELTMLRAVVANLPDLIYVKDTESRFLLANQGTADLMGAATVASLLGKTDFDFYPKELAADFFEDERKVLLSGQPLISRNENIKEPSGRTRCILTTKVALFDAA